MKLLSDGNTNAKTIKSNKVQDKFLTAILYLAPHTTAGKKNVCPKSSKGCRKACLFTAGRGVFHNVMQARKRKTNFYFNDERGFLDQLSEDITRFSAKCKRLGKKPAIRLNGTSDILWERTGIIDRFPKVRFYDYTKVARRFTRPRPKNYFLLFSQHENNSTDAQRIASRGHNVAVVFKGEMPKTYLGRKVINGDKHDLRFLDKKGVVVGLTAKGKAKRDTEGFVI